MTENKQRCLIEYKIQEFELSLYTHHIFLKIFFSISKETLCPFKWEHDNMIGSFKNII